MNCGILCDVLVFIKNIFKFIYNTLSIKNRPFLFAGIIVFIFLLLVFKIKPHFLYNLLFTYL